MARAGRGSLLLRGGLITLKQHRFEVIAGILLAAVVIGYAFFVEMRLAAINAPRDCVLNWLHDGSAGREHCEAVMGPWGALLGTEGQRVIAVSTLLPFVLGLLGGVPLVGRELELRTAQTAWSLNASRVAWLARQAVPVGAIFVVALVVVATASDVTVQHLVDWGQGVYGLLGGHGPLLLVHGLAALGVGLFVGALVGRTLPGLLVGVAIIGAVAVGAGYLRDAWVRSQTPTVVGQSPTSITVGWVWRTPEGSTISDPEAKALVPPDVAARDAGLAQAINSLEWLEQRGYVLLPLGVTDEAASAWAWYDAALYGVVGIVFIGASAWLVSKRRPT